MSFGNLHSNLKPFFAQEQGERKFLSSGEAYQEFSWHTVPPPPPSSKDCLDDLLVLMGCVCEECEDVAVVNHLTRAWFTSEKVVPSTPGQITKGLRSLDHILKAVGKH